MLLHPSPEVYSSLIITVFHFIIFPKSLMESPFIESANDYSPYFKFNLVLQHFARYLEKSP